jgi:Holliday junction resolvase RusA-like endonuclease
MKAHENNADSSETQQWLSTFSDSWTDKIAAIFSATGQYCTALIIPINITIKYIYKSKKKKVKLSQ